MHRILTRPYYKGIVRYNDVDYQGKHEPLVSDGETWQRVQDIMRFQSLGAEAARTPALLEGHDCVRALRLTTVRDLLTRQDGQALRLLLLRRSTPEANWLHAYPSADRTGGATDRGALPHSGAQCHWSGVQTGEAILEELAAEQLHLIEERKRAEERLRQLTDERMKLLQAHYVGAVPIDLLKTEQLRLTKDIKATERALGSNCG